MATSRLRKNNALFLFYSLFFLLSLLLFSSIQEARAESQLTTSPMVSRLEVSGSSL